MDYPLFIKWHEYWFLSFVKFRIYDQYMNTKEIKLVSLPTIMVLDMERFPAACNGSLENLINVKSISIFAQYI